MIAPTLLVGLGGTGSKIVCRVSKLINEEQRGQLGFAVFDTDINELRDIQRENPFIKIIQTSTKLSVGEYLNIDTHARDTWFPVNAILNSKTLTEGAGQVRAISRLAFDTALRAGKLEQLHEAIQDLYKLEEGRSEQALRVIIVSSLAGGTGSGLILPVALYIKNYLATHFRQSANITRGFFILPEVFDAVIVGQSERNSLRSNAYATLRELDAFLMKGDATLPDSFRDSVKMEFPRVSSNGYDEFNIRPYDFCFLFDAQNAEGSKLNAFNQYLDHAANCIYAQSIGPMNKRSNSSEDNTIRRLCEERGRNRYAGAGSSMLIYPMEDVKEYVALNWAKESVSKQWLVFDNAFREIQKHNAQLRAQGIAVADASAAINYITTVESMAKNKDAFAKAIVASCSVYDGDGITKISDKWTDYVNALLSKVQADQSAGQLDLEAQRDVAQRQISKLDATGEDREGEKGSWEPFKNAYRELEKYRAMVMRHSEDTANTIAFTMFRLAGDTVTADKHPHRLETYLRDVEGNFIHPCAVRYFLYKTLDLLKGHKTMIDKRNRDAIEFFDNFASCFDDPNTDVVETVEDLSRRKVALLSRLTGKLSGDQQDLRDAYSNFIVNVDEYRVNSVLALVLEEGIAYVTGLCDSFREFFMTFESRINAMDKHIAEISKRYEHTKGTTARYVCASKLCLESMLKGLVYTGGAISIDSALAEQIYSKVRAYSMLSAKPQNSSFFNEIFDEGIVGYFKDSVMRIYGSEVDMDIISALEMEARIELEAKAKAAAENSRKFEYSDKDVNAYVEKAIQNSRALSCPFIEKPLGEEKQPIYACAFHSSLDPDDSSYRSQLIAKELKNTGGVEDDNISRHMILFYQSFYGLRANDLSKFAPPEKTLTSTRDGGEYYKAYFDLISKIHPEAHRSKAITPHIDRWWHVVTKMPDLDEANQARQEQRIYAAFFWGLIGDYIDLFDIGADQKAYRLKVEDLDMEDDGSDVLIVSNGTPCDHLYEVLDAFAIYPELVERVLNRVETLTTADVDKARPIEQGLLLNCLRSFRVREYPLGDESKVRSVFDIPMLMKKSIKSEQYQEDSVLQILKAEIAEIKKYLSRIYAPKELPEAMGHILQEQYEMYLADMAEENRRKSVYHDYLFSRTCSIIAKAFEEIGLMRGAEEVRSKAKELSK